MMGSWPPKNAPEKFIKHYSPPLVIHYECSFVNLFYFIFFGFQGQRQNQCLQIYEQDIAGIERN